MDCGQIVEIGYQEFSRRLHDNVEAKRTPVKGGIDITSRCNLRCIHCYIEGTPLKDEHELTYEEICNIFDQIADAGCLWLLITGGEPLLRRDFADIYRYAKRKGFIITLFTNATLMTPEIADLLQEEPPFNIEISLYGMAGTYEQVTGVPGSFERCMRGINLLVERKLPFELKTMLLTTNYHEIQDMTKFAKSLGGDFRYDTQINASLDGLAGPLKLRPSAEDIVKLDMADEGRTKAMKELCEDFWRAPGHDRLYTCGAGINSFHITSSGDIVECVLSRRTNYNILQGSFKQGFYEAIPQVIYRKRTRYSECQACPMSSLCGICPALSELETGDPEAKLDWFCDLAHLRAKTFKTDWAKVNVTK